MALYWGQQCLLTWHTPARHALTYRCQACEPSGEAVRCPAAAPCWEGSAAEQRSEGLGDAPTLSSNTHGMLGTTAGMICIIKIHLKAFGEAVRVLTLMLARHAGSHRNQTCILC